MSDHDDDRHDPLVARLRQGLDRLTGDISAEPPALADVTPSPVAGGSRGRWVLGAAAAAAVALATASVFVATRDGGGDEPEIAPFDGATAIAPDSESGTGTTGSESSEQLYRAVATVLEDSHDGPQLCLGPVGESYPPQCDGLDITNWTWQDLASERESGARWGEYVAVGTYDREAQTFTLTQPARDAERGDFGQRPDVDFSTPCDAPEGGWPAASESDLSDAAQRIDRFGGLPGGAADTGATRPGSGIEGFGGLWLSREPFVLNVRVAGDLAAADAAIRELYDGPLCLVPSERTLAELQRIQDEMTENWPQEVSGMGVDVVAGQVRLDAFAPNPELERELAERYGDAVTVVVFGLIPIAPGEDLDPGPGTTPGTAGPAPAPAQVPPIGAEPGSLESTVPDTGPVVGTTGEDPDTPVSSPAVSNGLDRLDIELIVPERTVRSGGNLPVRLGVRNRSGETVTDPGCVIGSGPYALVPADEPDAELWLDPIVDCGGPMPMPDGYDEEYGISIPATTKFGDPLPPGGYVAAMEIEGYPERLEVPVTVT